MIFFLILFVPVEIHELKFRFQWTERQKSKLPKSHNQVHSMIGRNISHLADNFRIPLLFCYHVLSEDIQKVPGTVICRFNCFKNLK